MLPNPHDGPALVQQQGIGCAIARDVPVELRPPIGGVRARFASVNRAAMPEASVYEHRDSLPWEHDVGPDRSSAGNLYREIDAEPIPAAVQPGPQRQLGGRVSASVCSHDPPSHGGDAFPGFPSATTVGHSASVLQDRPWQHSSNTGSVRFCE